MDTTPPTRFGPLPEPSRMHREIERLSREHRDGQLARMELGLMRQFLAQLAVAAGGTLAVSAEEWEAARVMVGKLEIRGDGRGGILISATSEPSPD